MKKILQYSVLSYSPRVIANEKINLGIIFADEGTGYRTFEHIRKFSRLRHFDDEINLDLVKVLLKNIKEDVEGTLFTSSSFDILDYTKNFINEFSFDKPKYVPYDNLEELISRVKKTYLRFEYENKE